MGRVLVLYHSQEHGNTHAMAEAVGEGARTAGARVELVNTNERRLDVAQYREADAVAFGTPDYFGYVAGGLKMFADDWYIAKGNDRERLVGKPYALFYSHGGGGNVREPFEKLFKHVGGKQVGETIESRGQPNAAALDACRELGKRLAQAAK
ncbi:MAG: flavodoxin domain-containing protein [Candidatus Bipolaricaulota bacterium]